VSSVTAIRVLSLTAVAAGMLAVATGSPAAPVTPCTGSMLSGTFSVIPGSAGAGNIVYALQLRNRSPHPCFVSGLAGLRLLGRTGRPLPTRVEPAYRGALTAVRVVLNPGGVAKASARFTPDVPGPGEPTDRPCEPIAYKVRVTPRPGGGDLVVAVRPPTRVCVHGRIMLSALSPT
jgi:Domain of unknown function (DUF4232)